MNLSTFGLGFYTLYVGCKAVGWGPLVELTVRSSCFVSITVSKPIH